jgi:hypothetical protein
MKNVTISLDEEVARWARIWAAEHDTSISRMVGKLLKERMLQERSYQLAMEAYLSVQATAGDEGRDYETRDDLYTDRLRRY